MEHPNPLTQQLTELLQAGSYNFPGTCLALNKTTLDGITAAYKVPPELLENRDRFWTLTGFPLILAEELADNTYELQEHKGGYMTGAGQVPKVVNVIQRGEVFNTWPLTDGTIQVLNGSKEG